MVETDVKCHQKYFQWQDSLWLGEIDNLKWLENVASFRFGTQVLEYLLICGL